MASNPYYEGTARRAKPSIQFSRTELLHLAASVLILTVAFAFVLNSDSTTVFDPERFDIPPILWLASLLAVASGFVLHELAHKIVAQRYMHWAEFRGWFQGLLISLAVAAGLGVLFAAPGAVNIWGRVTPRENGIISIVGPGTNLVIALATLPFPLLGDITHPVPYVMSVVCLVNTVLAGFNLIPIMNLDGKKVLAWNKPIWFISIALAVGLFVFIRVAGLAPG